MFYFELFNFFEVLQRSWWTGEPTILKKKIKNQGFRSWELAGSHWSAELVAMCVKLSGKVCWTFRGLGG